MSFKEDKIKILEMICADMLPFETCSDDQNIVLNEDDFMKEGFSFNSALLILKDIFSLGSINKFDIVKDDNGKFAVNLTVRSDLESYTKILKYPEIEYEEFLDPNPTVPTKTCIRINSSRGIFKENSPELCYPLKTSTSRMKIIQCLLHKDRISLSELGKKTKQAHGLISKEIREINSNFRKKVIDDDFITRLPTNLYSLNRDKFDVKT